MMRYLLITIFLCFCSIAYAADKRISGMDALDFEYNSIDEIKDLDNAVNFYENLGKRLSDYKIKASNPCKDNKLSKEQCDILKKRYNSLRSKYITSGNLIIKDLEDSRLKEVYIIKYRRLRKEIMMELDKLETL